MDITEPLVNVEFKNVKFEDAEDRSFMVNSLSVSGNNCMGCKDRGKDIMLSIVDGDDGFVDFFLDQEQAIQLQKQLARNITFNELEM